MTTTGRFIEPLVRESTPSIIAEKLRKAIGHGELKPGAQLGEAELARELGVSRGPLREGMQRLTQEGLLVSIRNRGLFVIEMTSENVHDMYVARSAIERAAAEQIFRHDPVAAGDRLVEATEHMAAAAARKDTVAVGDADVSFHEVLVALAESPRLTRIHKTLLTETRMCIHALKDAYGSPGDRVAEHHGIAEAFRASAPKLVDELLVAHMDDALARLTADSPTPVATV